MTVKVTVEMVDSSKLRQLSISAVIPDIFLYAKDGTDHLDRHGRCTVVFIFFYFFVIQNDYIICISNQNFAWMYIFR